MRPETYRDLWVCLYIVGFALAIAMFMNMAFSPACASTVAVLATLAVLCWLGAIAILWKESKMTKESTQRALYIASIIFGICTLVSVVWPLPPEISFLLGGLTIIYWTGGFYVQWKDPKSGD